MIVKATLRNSSSNLITVVGTVVCSMAPALAAKLLQQRFKRDQGLSWKFELVRRRESLARAAAGAKVCSYLASCMYPWQW